jgi:predicted Rossmann fold nucleotide-binding protein DprA/Smf involved in DNA uptake
MPPEIAAKLLPPETTKEASKQAKPQSELVPADLTEIERQVWRLLSSDEAMQIDNLQGESSLSFGDLNTALLGLEMRELIRVLPGKCFARKI